MPRTKFETPCRNPQEATMTAQRILTANKYKQINENGELVWKCGNGFWTACKYVKIEFSGSTTAVLSGWIRPKGCDEQDLTGIVGSMPKKQIMKVLKEIQSAIR